MTDPKKQLNNIIKRLKESRKIPDRNKELILKFHENCFSEGIGFRRIVKYINLLTHINNFLGMDFEKAEKDDIKRMVAEIEKSDYAEWTKHDFKVAIKKFWKWMKGDEDVYPPEVRWVRTTFNKDKMELPIVMTQNEINQLINTATDLRTKAAVSCLYEMGARVGEFINMKIKDVSFDEYGAVVNIQQSKTKTRRLRLVTSSSYLASWIGVHPYRDDPEAYLWLSIGTVNHDKQLSYNTVRVMLRRLCKKAGIKKPCNPHSFRKSRASHLARSLTESQLCSFFGWKIGSDSARLYVNLSGRDMDDAILEINGIKPREKGKGDEFTASRCPRCGNLNSVGTSRFCSKCGLPLDEKAAIEAENKEKNLLQLITPETIDKMVEEKVKEILANIGAANKADLINQH